MRWMALRDTPGQPETSRKRSCISDLAMAFRPALDMPRHRISSKRRMLDDSAAIDFKERSVTREHIDRSSSTRDVKHMATSLTVSSSTAGHLEMLSSLSLDRNREAQSTMNPSYEMAQHPPMFNDSRHDNELRDSMESFVMLRSMCRLRWRTREALSEDDREWRPTSVTREQPEAFRLIKYERFVDSACTPSLPTRRRFANEISSSKGMPLAIACRALSVSRVHPLTDRQRTRRHPRARAAMPSSVTRAHPLRSTFVNA